jgi:hypothetical protein
MVPSAALAWQTDPSKAQYVEAFDRILGKSRTDRNYNTLPTAPRLKPPKPVHGDKTPSPEPEEEAVRRPSKQQYGRR